MSGEFLIANLHSHSSSGKLDFSQLFKPYDNIESMAWRVLFFRTARGSSPVEDFTKEQDEATYAKVLQAIQLLANNGPFLKPLYIKKLQEKLYELRISGKVAIRIFYTITNNEYYLLHAFKKKSQKTPSKELKVALDRMKELI